MNVNIDTNNQGPEFKRSLNIQNKRPWLIVATVFFVVVCIALPLEYRNAEMIVDFPYTSISLGIAVLLAMYGFMGDGIFRRLLILLISGTLSAIIWFFLIRTNALYLIVAVLVGFPIGLLAGLLFLILEAIFLKKKIGNGRFVMQIALLLGTIIVVSGIFFTIGNYVN